MLQPAGQRPVKRRGFETLRIAYATPTTDRAEMDSFNHSVALGQYRIVPIENGVRVEYRLGDEYRMSSTRFAPADTQRQDGRSALKGLFRGG